MPPAPPAAGGWGAGIAPYLGPAPAVVKKGKKDDALEQHYESWLDIANNPALLMLELKSGVVMEGATMNGQGVIDGTCLLVIREKATPTNLEHFWRRHTLEPHRRSRQLPWTPD